MTFLGKSIIKQQAISELLPFTKQYFFRKANIFDHTFFYRLENEVSCHFTISPGTGQSFSIGGEGLSYLKVERILLKLLDIEIEEKALYQFSTVKIINDKHNNILHKGVSTLEDVTEICSDFKSIFIEDFLPAFEKYSNPKEVLSLWDSLEDKGRSDYFFSPYKHIKMIILSKMCNDLEFEKRGKDAYAFYKGHFENGVSGAETLMKDCEKVIQYLEENEV